MAKDENFRAYLRDELLRAHCPLDDVDAITDRIARRASILAVRIAFGTARTWLAKVGYRFVAQGNGRFVLTNALYDDPDDDGIDDLLE